jgi:YgiT-type zinc finger domain-containing protein
MRQSNAFCPVCRGGHKRPGTTAFTVDLGFGVVAVRDVPARVCDLCGTDWIDDATAETLERVVDQARRKPPVVEVSSWDDQIRALDG